MSSEQFDGQGALFDAAAAVEAPPGRSSYAGDPLLQMNPTRALAEAVVDRLADRPVQPARPTDTQLAAGARTAPRIRGHRARILALLQRQGVTDEQIATATGLGLNTVRPRRGELVSQGLVEDSGQRGRTATGSPAIIWRVTDAGRQQQVDEQGVA